MIRINLLPEKKKRKKPKPIPGFIIAAVVLTTIVTVGVIFVFYMLKTELQSLKDTVARNDQRLAVLRKKLKELKNYENLLQEVQRKKEVIVSLRKNQVVPVKLLDELSRHLPDSVWFKTLSMKGSRVTIEGFAFTNSDIVNFVNKLKGSEFFRSVFLIETRRQEISERELREKITVYNFKLTMQIRG